ncbi:MAG TPA: hypothetical protein V6C81_10610 [Planktothrix sp.]|jgi:elongation factor P
MPTDESMPKKFPLWPGTPPGVRGKYDEDLVVVANCHYSYRDGDNYVLVDSETYDQVEVTAESIGPQVVFLKEGLEGITILIWNNRVFGIELPRVVELEVVSLVHLEEGRIEALLESGAKIVVPERVKVGDIVKVDPRTAKYVAPPGH